MFESALHRENYAYHNKLSFKDWKNQIQFISIDWRRFTTENEMAHTRLWTPPIALENMDNMGCDLLERKLWETVGIFKFQVRRKMFVPFLIEIGGLMITSLREKIGF